MKEIAIIGPTASGKSDLALDLAKNMDAYILSIDSLSIYKEIDIISAKPSKEELQTTLHFGIDHLMPSEHFSVNTFIKIYQDSLLKCQEDGKNLVIVGGTSFYLKSLMDGISELPTYTPDVFQAVEYALIDLYKAYQTLLVLDPHSMQNIAASDKYRIEKMLLIYHASGLTPSQWFAKHPPKPLISQLSLYNIDTPRDLLRQRIQRRTQKMLEMGAIDEVAYLEQKYTRMPNAMKSIGIVEILEYLDGKADFDTMTQNITTHTAQLAKRQQTFNKTQFENIISEPLEVLQKRLL